MIALLAQSTATQIAGGMLLAGCLTALVILYSTRGYVGTRAFFSLTETASSSPVRTPPFHGGNSGSNPDAVTTHRSLIDILRVSPGTGGRR